MTEACEAAYTGLPAPSLLPRHAEAEEDGYGINRIMIIVENNPHPLTRQ